MNIDTYTNDTLISLDVSELHKLIKIAQYSIKMNENACIIAKKASNAANIAVNCAYNEIAKFKVFKNINNISKQIIIFSNDILNKMNILQLNLTLIQHRNQIIYLYQLVDNMKKREQCNSISSRETPITLYGNNFSSRSDLSSLRILDNSDNDNDNNYNNDNNDNNNNNYNNDNNNNNNNDIKIKTRRNNILGSNHSSKIYEENYNISKKKSTNISQYLKKNVSKFLNFFKNEYNGDSDIEYED